MRSGGTSSSTSLIVIGNAGAGSDVARTWHPVTTLVAMLLFDTNQLRQVYPGSLSLRLLTAASRRTGHRLAITDIVLEEAVRQRRDDLVKQGTALANSYEEFQNSCRRNSGQRAHIQP